MANALRFWQDVLLLPLPKYLQLDLIINAIINVVMLLVWKYLKHFYIFMLFLKIFARKLLNSANCKIILLPLPCFTCLNFYVNLKNRFPYCKKQSWKKRKQKNKKKKRNMAVAIPKGRKSCKFLTPQTSNVSNYPELWKCHTFKVLNFGKLWMLGKFQEITCKIFLHHLFLPLMQVIVNF